MTKKLNISIPKPCSADWDKMSPCEQGRHCSACDKTVVDFTKMSSDQMDEFIIQNFDAKICGHFYQKQLSIPENKFHSFFLGLYSKAYSNLKVEVPRVAALFVLGSILSLTGCDESKKGEIETRHTTPIETKGRVIKNSPTIEGKISHEALTGISVITPTETIKEPNKNMANIKGKVSISPTKIGEVCIPEENNVTKPNNAKAQKK